MSAEAGRLPTSGYLFEQTYVSHLSLAVVESSAGLPAEQGLVFGWDWQMVGDGHFEVILQFGIDASQTRPEEVRVTLSGRFRAVGNSPEVDLANFVRFHAPAILMPYVREIVTSLTARGFYGPVVLPPINVQTLMDGQNTEETTGHRQLLESHGATM